MMKTVAFFKFGFDNNWKSSLGLVWYPMDTNGFLFSSGGLFLGSFLQDSP
jgi:hypothetical protein